MNFVSVVLLLLFGFLLVKDGGLITTETSTPTTSGNGSPSILGGYAIQDQFTRIVLDIVTDAVDTPAFGLNTMNRAGWERLAELAMDDIDLESSLYNTKNHSVAENLEWTTASGKWKATKDRSTKMFDITSDPTELLNNMVNPTEYVKKMILVVFKESNSYRVYHSGGR